jgi:DNA-binding GntR family transcriptional regulator
MASNARRVDIDRGSPVPIYQQIAEYIRTRIEDGQYPPGSLVPPLQRIHQETGVAVKTIQKGIGLLAADGWVLIVTGKGTYVNQPARWPKEREES